MNLSSVRHLRETNRCFRRSEAGNATIEATFWVPFFFMLMMAAGQLAIIFYGQSRTQEIAQTATRAYSVGDLSSESEVSAYVKGQLSNLSQSVTVDATVTDGLITTVVAVPAGAFGGPLRIFPDLAGLQIQVVAQQVKEL